MGVISMVLYLKHLRIRYQRADKKLKSQLLKEFCEAHGYHIKSAVRLLNKPPVPEKKLNKGGKPPTYDKSKVLVPLKHIWLATDQMCGKRLKKALPLWLPFYGAHFEELDAETVNSLLTMSASTIDRLLKPLKIGARKGLSGTKPGTLLKNQIPLKTGQWDTTTVGFVEADTVAHCGDSLRGDFVWSLTLTDIASGWTENRATWNKGAFGVVEQIKDIEKSLPFSILGFDCDNGSEFLNYHLMRYFSDENNNMRIEFTRSRPYKKNDNAHVEQKNWTHVRQLFGYHRFDDASLVALMNDLYANEFSMLMNYFCPSVKLIDKKRVKSNVKKVFDEPKTPYQRLMEHPGLSCLEKEVLTIKYKTLDPFQLQKIIQKKLKVIFRNVNLKNRQKRKAL